MVLVRTCSTHVLDPLTRTRYTDSSALTHPKAHVAYVVNTQGTDQTAAAILTPSIDTADEVAIALAATTGEEFFPVIIDSQTAYRNVNLSTRTVPYSTSKTFTRTLVTRPPVSRWERGPTSYYQCLKTGPLPKKEKTTIYLIGCTVPHLQLKQKRPPSFPTPSITTSAEETAFRRL